MIVPVAPAFMFAAAYRLLQCTSPVTPNDPFWSTSKFGAFNAPNEDIVKRAPAPRARPPNPVSNPATLIPVSAVNLLFKSVNCVCASLVNPLQKCKLDSVTLLNALLRLVSEDVVYHACILVLRRQEFILVRFTFVDQNDCDKLSKHELIVVTLSDTDLSDALVIQNCCDTLSKQELIFVTLVLIQLSKNRTLHETNNSQDPEMIDVLKK